MTCPSADIRRAPRYRFPSTVLAANISAANDDDAHAAGWQNDLTLSTCTNLQPSVPPMAAARIRAPRWSARSTRRRSFGLPRHCLGPDEAFLHGAHWCAGIAVPRRHDALLIEHHGGDAVIIRMAWRSPRTWARRRPLSRAATEESLSS